MTRDELCSKETIFLDKEGYVFSRYEETEQDLYFKAWSETFENSPVLNNDW